MLRHHRSRGSGHTSTAIRRAWASRTVWTGATRLGRFHATWECSTALPLDLYCSQYSQMIWVSSHPRQMCINTPTILRFSSAALSRTCIVHMVITRLEAGLASLDQWFRANGLKVNARKTQIITFGSQQNKNGSSQSKNSSAMWNTIFSCSLDSCFVSLGGIKWFIFACISKKCVVFLPLTGPLQSETLQRQYEPGPAPRPAVSRCRRLRGGDLHLSATDTGRLGARFLTLSRLAKARKRQNIYKCTPKCVISISPKDTKPEYLGHG